MMDEDGDMFWDAVEGDDEGMQGFVFRYTISFLVNSLRHFTRLEIETAPASSPSNPLKRYRSPTPTNTTSSQPRLHDPSDSYSARQPKRLRRNKEIPDHDAPPDLHALKAMGRSNPLNRRTQKRDRKRARKIAHRVAMAARGDAGGMEVDSIDRLEERSMI